jgi:hypothetical protein
MTHSSPDNLHGSGAAEGWAKWLIGAASTGTAAAAFFFPRYAVFLLLIAQGIAVGGVIQGDRLFAVATTLLVAIALIQSPAVAMLVTFFPPIFLLFAAFITLPFIAMCFSSTDPLFGTEPQAAVRSSHDGGERSHQLAPAIQTADVVSTPVTQTPRDKQEPPNGISRRPVLVFVLVLVLVAVAWCQTAFPSYSHRYRLTIAIETDGKIHTGSSVIEVTFEGQPRLEGSGTLYTPHVGGQAVFVDVGRHGTVVAALNPGMIENRSLSATFLAMQAYGIDGNEAYRTIRQKTGRRDLVPNKMPLLIWFRDATDPATGRVIKAEQVPDLFGPTARLASAYLEITSDRVVIDIDQKLPWLTDLVNRQHQRGVTSRPNEFQIRYTMFVGPASIRQMVDQRR